MQIYKINFWETGRSTSSSSQTRNFAEEHAFTRAPTREEDPQPPKAVPAFIESKGIHSGLFF